MARTLVDIQDDLMENARRAIGPGVTKAETVRTALEIMSRSARQTEALRWFAEADPLADLRDPDLRKRSLVLTIRHTDGRAVLYLVDNSVLQRMRRAEVLASTMSLVDAGGVLASCVVSVDEASYSARSASDLHDVRQRLREDFRFLEQDTGSDQIVEEIRQALFAAGKGRAAGTRDLAIAAVAVRYDAVVLHYDEDFAHMASVMPRFRQQWVITKGSID